jgi:hypothetical protein
VWQADTRNDAQEEHKKKLELRKLAYEVGGDLGLLVEKMKAQLAREQSILPSQSPQRHSRLPRRPPRGQERRFDISALTKAKVVPSNKTEPILSRKTEPLGPVRTVWSKQRAQRTVSTRGDFYVE